MRGIDHPAGHVLQAFHDGELEASAAADVSAHCEACHVCRAELEELERAEQLLAAYPAPEPPRTVWHRVRPGRERGNRLRPAIGVAACAAGIVLGVLLGPVRFTAEEPGRDSTWAESVTVWNGGASSSLLGVYQTGQD